MTDPLREPRAPKWAGTGDADYEPTEDDLNAYSEYERAYRVWEELVAHAHVVDLAPLIAGEFTPPEMLTPRIVAGTTTTVAGQRAKGKTWMVGHDAVQIMKGGGNVVWVDLEMGRVRTAERFKTLGLTPADSEHLTYFESPMMPGANDADGWRPFWAGMMQNRKPALVVIDAVTEALSVAGLDDYRGIDVARWHSWYASPALLEDAAVVYIDHTPQGGSRTIGSVHKENQAKVVLVVSCPTRFDREHVGVIEVRCTKNTHAAEIADRQRYRIGHDPLTERFVFEAIEGRPAELGEGMDAAESGIAKARTDVLKRVAGLTEEDGLATGDLKKLVGGKADYVVKALEELREGDHINATKVGRSIVYWQRIPD